MVAAWKASIYDSGGNKVMEFDGSGVAIELAWDGKNYSDRTVPYGEYDVQVWARIPCLRILPDRR